MEPRAKGRRVGCVLVAASALGFSLSWLAHPPLLRSWLPLRGPSWWAADRDVGAVGGGALEGLDASLRPCARVRAPYPVRVAASGDGGAWLVCAVGGSARGPHELWRIDSAARRTERHAIAEPLDLAAAHGGDLFVLVGGRGKLVRYPPHGPPLWIAELPGATCVAADAAHVAIGSEGGQLVLLSHDGFFVDEVVLTAACTDVAPHPDGWSALAARELVRFDTRLRKSWSVPLALERPRLASGASASTWVHDELGERLLRVGADGRIELDLVSPVRSLRAVVARDDGSALVATDGALLCVTSGGEWRIGQGGFDALVDVCAAR